MLIKQAWGIKVTYLSDEGISGLGLFYVGKNVKISESAKIYEANKMSIGDNSRIDDFVVLSGNVQIGRNVHIAVHCSITASTNQIIFEDFSGVSFGSHIFGASEDYTGVALTNPTVPSQFRKNVRGKSVRIGRHVVIGASSVVFPGVHIADGCAIGAHSTVTKSTEAWGIYIGSPARRINSRSKDILKFEEEYLNSEQ
jgi:acetyltransferase-like isoleucine patch superfamily enzyme